ncbi:MAG: divergent polysaccharide deacetylase family protein [Pseudomonadota bacterium]
MGRGFLSGLFWGGILSLVALFVSNQTLDRQSLSFPRPEAAAVEVPGGSEFNQARPETDPVVPGTDARPEGDAVAEVAVPEEEGTEPPNLETSALEVPVPTTTQDAPDALGDAPAAVEDIEEPIAANDAAVETDAADALVVPDAPAPAPETAEVDVEVQEAAPVEEEERAPLIIIHDAPPSDGETEVAALPEAEADPEQPDVEVTPQVSGQIEAPSVPRAPDAPDTADLPWLDRLRASQIDEAPEAPELPTVSEEPSLPPVTPASPEAPVEEDAVVAAVEEALTPAADEEAPVAPIVIEAPSQPEVAEPETAGDGDGLLQPVETLTERDATGSGATGALPVVRRLGDSSVESETEEAPEPTEAETTETDAESAEVDETAPALARYATEFEAPQGVPLLSIVLVHQGAAALNAQLLEILPPNIGFAIDASLPGAADIARTYRSAGREVIMIPALPAGAAPQDIEQALGANFDLVPEAVAVMDVSGSSFQSDRAAVEQVVDVVAASGHGMITFPRGLNTAHQAAQRAGVPTGLIFRNLDGSSEDQETIRRSLDRAAFRARQDEAVILVGTTGSTMLSALTEWVLGNRAATVAIAPVSAALGG